MYLDRPQRLLTHNQQGRTPMTRTTAAHKCHECHMDIPRGELVQRSFSLQTRSFHKWCFNRKFPAPRGPADDIL